jgi:hypothetical protein
LIPQLPYGGGVPLQVDGVTLQVDGVTLQVDCDGALNIVGDAGCRASRELNSDDRNPGSLINY